MKNISNSNTHKSIIENWCKLTIEGMIGYIKDYYENFDVKSLTCKCGVHNRSDWTRNGSYKKKIHVYDEKKGEFVTETVRLKRYCCPKCSRTITAFPPLILRWKRYLLPEALNAVWHHTVKKETIVSVCLANGMSESAYCRLQHTYCHDILEYLPKAFHDAERSNYRRGYIAKIMPAIFGKAPVTTGGMNVLHKNSLKDFTDSFEYKACRPFLQTRSPWREGPGVKKRDSKNHFYGSFPGITQFESFYHLNTA